MNEIKTIKGTIMRLYGNNALSLSLGGYGNNKIFSQFGGLDVEVDEGDIVEFKYTEKQKDGKVYNNIVAGSVSVVNKGFKDVTHQYSQEGSQSSTPFPLDTNTLIVRQNVLNRAIDLVNHGKIELDKWEEWANRFELWVNREVKE